MEIKKLYPVCKDYTWGGDKLKKKYGKDPSCDPCAESWELSFHPYGPTMLEDGTLLSDVATEKEIGTNAKDFPFFPALVKFIDAKNSPSVPMRPYDKYANNFDKIKVWYIVEAEKGAGIYLGLDRPVSREEYKRAIRCHALTKLLRFFPVKAGESYFIHSGTPHAIGAGCLIYEIQQNSNPIYRCYDNERGHNVCPPKELDAEKTMQVTNRNRYTPPTFFGKTLGVSKYFNVRKLNVRVSLSLNATEKSFHCITCTRGSGKIGGQSIKKGDSFFIPAGFGNYTLDGYMTTILTDIRRYCLGINIGKNLIRCAIIDDEGNIVFRGKVTTDRKKGEDIVFYNILILCRHMAKQVGIQISDFSGIGIDVPDPDCLDLDYPCLADKISNALGIQSKIARSKAGDDPFKAVKLFK